MEQHAVPQNITSYQFRLVGDMTLKQFLELAGGFVLAYIFFISNLLFFIKWPLVILSVLLGISLAFFPVEERPLDQWIINFLKSIYSPTRFIWKKSSTPPAIFTYTKKQVVEEKTILEKAQKTKGPQTPQLVQEIEMDDTEKARLNQISSLIDKSSPTSQSPQGTIKFKPTKPSIRSFQPPMTKRADSVVYDSSKQTPTQILQKQPTNQTKTSKVPTTQGVILKTPTATKEKIENIQEAQTIKVQMPLTPTSPNIVVGMVTTQQGKLVEGAIVEILDEKGIPQRAVKTNQLGQFFTATPLSNGTYIIKVEKDDVNMAPQKIKVEGNILPPILLQGI